MALARDSLIDAHVFMHAFRSCMYVMYVQSCHDLLESLS